jgi:hypothetical protein
MRSTYSSFVFEFVNLPVYTVYAYLLFSYTANSISVCFIIITLINLINLLICRILTILVAGDSGFVFLYLFICVFIYVFILVGNTVYI